MPGCSHVAYSTYGQSYLAFNMPHCKAESALLKAPKTLSVPLSCGVPMVRAMRVARAGPRHGSSSSSSFSESLIAGRQWPCVIAQSK